MTETKTCRTCGESLEGKTVIGLECGRTLICAQCLHDMDEMSGDLNDMIEEFESERDDDEYISRWSTDGN